MKLPSGVTLMSFPKSFTFTGNKIWGPIDDRTSAQPNLLSSVWLPNNSAGNFAKGQRFLERSNHEMGGVILYAKIFFPYCTINKEIIFVIILYDIQFQIKFHILWDWMKWIETNVLNIALPASLKIIVIERSVHPQESWNTPTLKMFTPCSNERLLEETSSHANVQMVLHVLLSYCLDRLTLINDPSKKFYFHIIYCKCRNVRGGLMFAVFAVTTSPRI